MDKKKTEIIITSSLIVIFIIAAANGIVTVAKKKQQADKYSSVNTARPAKALSLLPSDKTLKIKNIQGIEKEKPLQQDHVSQAILLRDPFTRESKPVSGYETNVNAAPAILTGIIYDKKNPSESYCIVNGETVKLGGVISGFTITNIGPDSVVVSNEDKNQEYKLSIGGE